MINEYFLHRKLYLLPNANTQSRIYKFQKEGLNQIYLNFQSPLP